MKKIACVSLTEWMNGIYTRHGTYGTWLEEQKKDTNEIRFERVYFGSNFCSLYFLKSQPQMMKALTLFAERDRMKITLVVPVFTQKNLTAAKQKIDELLEAGGSYIDEVTVNDYGMLEYIQNNYQVTINLGRLFMKDYRDRRYQDYFQQTVKPKLFNEEFNRFRKSYRIGGVEMDQTHQSIDLSDAEDSLTIGIYYPDCYQTVGNICEAASSMVPTHMKFRPNHECSMECEQQYASFEMEGVGTYHKRGRAVFFSNPDCQISGHPCIRIIYSPKIEGAAE